MSRFGRLGSCGWIHSIPDYARAESNPDSIFRTRDETLGLILVYICLDSYAIGLAIYDWNRRLH